LTHKLILHTTQILLSLTVFAYLKTEHEERDCYVGSIQYTKIIFEQNLEAGLQKPILSEFVSFFMTLL